MKNWKKNIMAASILLVVCVGIYTNWMYTNAESVHSLTDYLDSDKVLGENGIIMDDEAVMGDDADTVSSYFAAVRLSRQEARDSAVSLLQEAMAYGDAQTNQQTSGVLFPNINHFVWVNVCSTSWFLKVT